MKFVVKNMKFAIKNMKFSIQNMKFSIKTMKISIKNMKLSIKNMKFSVYKVCQNSSFVLFITEFSYHMYRKNAVLNGKQKQMKPLLHCCIKCPQILMEKTSSQNSHGIALRIQCHFFHHN